MTRDPNREYDKTSLRSTSYGYVVHRDYAAHFFRWGWVSMKFINNSTRVLDIGCGPDGSLVKVLRFKLANGVPQTYLGVDLHPLNKMPSAPWVKWRGKFEFDKRWRELDGNKFNLVTCFEVVEHMRMPAVRRLLRGARELVEPHGKLILSTPVFNGKMAANHINEMTVETLHRELVSAGWHVARRYGTFMSDGDRKKCATPAESALVERLKEYYSGDVVACFLAPLYPDHSRNNVWVCTRDVDVDMEELL